MDHSDYIPRIRTAGAYSAEIIRLQVNLAMIATSQCEYAKPQPHPLPLPLPQSQAQAQGGSGGSGGSGSGSSSQAIRQASDQPGVLPTTMLLVGEAAQDMLRTISRLKPNDIPGATAAQISTSCAVACMALLGGRCDACANCRKAARIFYNVAVGTTAAVEIVPNRQRVMHQRRGRLDV